jgi:hypothetical protein
VQRLNAVVPGRWRQQFQAIPGELTGGERRRLYLACRLIVTLPPSKSAVRTSTPSTGTSSTEDR